MSTQRRYATLLGSIRRLVRDEGPGISTFPLRARLQLPHDVIECKQLAILSERHMVDVCS